MEQRHKHLIGDCRRKWKSPVLSPEAIEYFLRGFSSKPLFLNHIMYWSANCAVSYIFSYLLQTWNITLQFLLLKMQTREVRIMNPDFRTEIWILDWAVTSDLKKPSTLFSKEDDDWFENRTFKTPLMSVWRGMSYFFHGFFFCFCIW